MFGRKSSAITVADFFNELATKDRQRRRSNFLHRMWRCRSCGTTSWIPCVLHQLKKQWLMFGKIRWLLQGSRRSNFRFIRSYESLMLPRYWGVLEWSSATANGRRHWRRCSWVQHRTCSYKLRHPAKAYFKSSWCEQTQVDGENFQ